MHSSTGLPPQLRPAPMSSLRQLDVQRGPGSVPWCSGWIFNKHKVGRKHVPISSDFYLNFRFLSSDSSDPRKNFIWKQLQAQPIDDVSPIIHRTMLCPLSHEVCASDRLHQSHVSYVALPLVPTQREVLLETSEQRFIQWICRKKGRTNRNFTKSLYAYGFADWKFPQM